MRHLRLCGLVIRLQTPLGNDNFTGSPSGTFRTGSGPINIAANKQEQFVALCHVVGHDGEALAVDTPPPQLGEHTAELLAELGFTNSEINKLRDNNAI